MVVLAVWGWRTGDGAWRIVLAVAAPLAFAVVWGLLFAPRAPVRLPCAVGTAGRVAMFVVAAAAANAVWGWPVALVIFVAGVLNAVASRSPAHQRAAGM